MIATVLFSGCATASKSARESGQPNPTAAPAPEVYGPPVTPAPPAYGPEPISVRPVVLVLGPGLARGFAYAGAIEALTNSGVPIGAILGTEVGALVATLYAMSGNENDFEWALVQIKDDALTERNSFFSNWVRHSSAGDSLSEELRGILGSKDLQAARIPLRIAIQKSGASNSIVLDRGLAAQAVRAAISVPGALSPVSWDGGLAESSDGTLPFLVDEAKRLGIGPVVVVDVLGGGSGAVAPTGLVAMMARSEAVGQAELKEADVVIRPEMSGFGYLDFSRRTDAEYLGKSATEAQLRDIKKWVGLPE